MTAHEFLRSQRKVMRAGRDGKRALIGSTDANREESEGDGRPAGPDLG